MLLYFPIVQSFLPLHHIDSEKNPESNILFSNPLQCKAQKSPLKKRLQTTFFFEQKSSNNPFKISQWLSFRGNRNIYIEIILIEKSEKYSSDGTSKKNFLISVFKRAKILFQAKKIKRLSSSFNQKKRGNVSQMDSWNIWNLRNGFEWETSRLDIEWKMCEV